MQLRCVFNVERNLVIAKNSTINANSHLDNRGFIEIGDL
jgi:hypothetical protein